MYVETHLATLLALQFSADSNHKINASNIDSVKNNGFYCIMVDYYYF